MDIQQLAEKIKLIKGTEIVTIKGPENYKIKIMERDGSHFISFLNSEDQECIGIDYGDNKIYYLGNYYFNTPENCIRIPHDWFFNEFLIPLATILGVKKIELDDNSFKKFESCSVPMIFFALSGKPTFYNKYGFENPKFNAYIEKLKTKKLRGLIDLDLGELVKSSGKRIPFKLMDSLIVHGVLDKPIPEIAQFVLDTCKNKSSRKNDKFLANNIIKFFNLKLDIDRKFEKQIGSGNRKTKVVRYKRNKSKKL